MQTQSKTAREPYQEAAAIEALGDGVWRVNSYAAARAIMLADATAQAGFKAELLEKMPKYMALPMLYQSGAEHRELRSQTAKYFTPATTHERYLPLMERCADQIVADFQKAGRADVGDLSALMAMTVAAEVIGLTNSSVKHMLLHLSGILTAKINFSLKPKDVLTYVKVQYHLLHFFLRDVLPAVRARRKRPQNDVITHLLSKGRKPLDILTECIMYGAAGMVTTREFIGVGMWHCLQDAELRAIMTGADQEARARLLHEMLRLEPVVGHIYRRATTEISAPGASGPVIIAAGDLIDLNVYSINADTRAVGAEPLNLQPERHTTKGVPGAALSFGAGTHRCVGEFVAMAESDVLLQRLLKLDKLRIVRPPEVGQNDITSGYELRNFIIALHSST